LKKYKKMKRKRIVITYVIVLGILMLASIIVTIASATRGAEISYLERKRHQSKQTYEELSSQLITSTSLTQVSSQASQLGLVKPSQIIYLDNADQVASLR